MTDEKTLMRILELDQPNNTSPRERDVLRGIISALQYEDAGEEIAPKWLTGLLLGLSDPNLSKRYETALSWLASSQHPTGETPPEILGRSIAWRGNPEVGRLVMLASHHAGELHGILGEAYTQGLLDCIRPMTAADADPTGDPNEFETWKNIETSINWAHVCCQMIGTREANPENERALEMAESIRECLQWARTRVDSVLRERNNPEPLAAHKGRTLYYNRILEESRAKPGEFVIIDIRSGDYQVGHSDRDASRILRERQPDAFTWTERAGYPSPYVATVRPRARRHTG